ncbi:hypothetical protein AB1N83_004224 [Pleurotus pulmonarius]
MHASILGSATVYHILSKKPLGWFFNISDSQSSRHELSKRGQSRPEMFCFLVRLDAQLGESGGSGPPAEGGGSVMVRTFCDKRAGPAIRSQMGGKSLSQ